MLPLSSPGVWSVLSKGLILLSVFTNIFIFCFTSEQLMNYAPSLFDVIEVRETAILITRYAYFWVTLHPTLLVTWLGKY